MNEAILNRLMCPRTQKSLRILDNQEWNLIQDRLTDPQVETAFGATIQPEGGAICIDEKPEDVLWFYPLADGLLYLMPNDAVDLG